MNIRTVRPTAARTDTRIITRARAFALGLGLTLTLASVVGVAGCTTSAGEPTPEKSSFVAVGQADWAYDPCEDNGWYGDGECDGFCPLPDPDCSCVTAAGTSLAEGETAWEGCNTCTCLADGTFSCEVRESCTAPHCERDGLAYAPGDSVADGGCNSCTCQVDGTFVCTERDCAAAPVCVGDDGVAYEAGASVPDADGCNLCTCQPDGSFVCTERDCAPVGCEHDGMSYAPGESFSDGCNGCTCQATGEIVCTLRACAGS